MSLITTKLKEMVYPKIQFNTFATHPYVDVGSGSNPHNHSGGLRIERTPSSMDA